MSILAWIIFGLSVGIIANSIDPRPAYGGILGAIFLGVTGAIIGGVASAVVLMVLNGDFGGLSLTSVLVALMGSLAFLMIGKSIRRA